MIFLFFFIFQKQKVTPPPLLELYEIMYMIGHMCEGFLMKMTIEQVYDFWLVTCHIRQHCAQVLYFLIFLQLMLLIWPQSCQLGFFHENVHRPSLWILVGTMSHKTTLCAGFIFFWFFEINGAHLTSIMPPRFFLKFPYTKFSIFFPR